MKSHRLAKGFTSFVISIAILSWFSAAKSAHAQERLRVGYSGISGYQAPVWLGVDLGLFKKYGLNLEPILFRGGAESTLALTGNQIQFDVVSPQPHIAADLAKLSPGPRRRNLHF